MSPWLIDVTFSRLFRIIFFVFLPCFPVFSSPFLSCRGGAPLSVVREWRTGGWTRHPEGDEDGRPSSTAAGYSYQGLVSRSLDLRFPCDLSFGFPHTDFGSEFEGDSEIDVDAHGVGGTVRDHVPTVLTMLATFPALLHTARPMSRFCSL